MDLVLELVSRYAGSKFRACACSVSKSVHMRMIAISSHKPIFAKYYNMNLARITESDIILVVRDYHLFVRIRPTIDLAMACYGSLSVVTLLTSLYIYSYDEYAAGLVSAVHSGNKHVVVLMLRLCSNTAKCKFNTFMRAISAALKSHNPSMFKLLIYRAEPFVDVIRDYYIILYNIRNEIEDPDDRFEFYNILIDYESIYYKTSHIITSVYKSI